MSGGRRALWTNATAGDLGEGEFSVGDVVQASFGGEVEYFGGKITKAHDDGTYDITYNDDQARGRGRELGVLCSVGPSGVNCNNIRRASKRLRNQLCSKGSYKQGCPKMCGACEVNQRC